MNYSKSKEKEREKYLESPRKKIELEELSHMNSTYNFAKMRKIGTIANPSEKLKILCDLNGKKDSFDSDPESLKYTLQCFRLKKDESKNIFKEEIDEKNSKLPNLDQFCYKKFHDSRLVEKSKKKKQIGKRGILL